MSDDQRPGRAGPIPGGHAADPADWQTPAAAGPLRAQLRLPGSKSMTNRALVLAALAEDQTVITGPLLARDTRLMASALSALGCEITPAGQAGGDWLVRPAGPLPAGHATTIDVGNAGTVLRFAPPVASLTRAVVRFTGDERIAQRPVRPLLDALRRLGADIDDHGTGATPFTVTGRGALRGGSVTMDTSSSSQLVSGLLLAAARFADGVRIRHEGPPIPSAPHIEMTVRMLRGRGVQVITGADGLPADSGQAAGGPGSQDDLPAGTWVVEPGQVAGGSIEIEPDLSNAVPFLAAALAVGGEVTVRGWPPVSLQPVGRVVALLEAMGATVTRTEDGLRVCGSGQVDGVRASLREVSELAPVLTALAAIARSPSEFTGIGHTRRHETDRLAALAAEIGRLGATVTELPDGLAIKPGRLRADGAMFDSHDDHRLVMAAAVLGLGIPGLRVHNAVTVGKTFPGFTGVWTQMMAAAG